MILECRDRTFHLTTCTSPGGGLLILGHSGLRDRTYHYRCQHHFVCGIEIPAIQKSAADSYSGTRTKQGLQPRRPRHRDANNAGRTCELGDRRPRRKKDLPRMSIVVVRQRHHTRFHPNRDWFVADRGVKKAPELESNHSRAARLK